MNQLFLKKLFNKRVELGTVLGAWDTSGIKTAKNRHLLNILVAGQTMSIIDIINKLYINWPVKR